jgi:hypothetical protein
MAKKAKKMDSSKKMLEEKEMAPATNGLTAAQKKLPPALQKAMLAKKKKAGK